MPLVTPSDGVTSETGVKPRTLGYITHVTWLAFALHEPGPFHLHKYSPLPIPVIVALDSDLLLRAEGTTLGIPSLQKEQSIFTALRGRRNNETGAMLRTFVLRRSGWWHGTVPRVGPVGRMILKNRNKLLLLVPFPY